MLEGDIHRILLDASGLTFPFAELLTEGLAQLLSGLSVHLTGEDISDGIEDHL